MLRGVWELSHAKPVLGATEQGCVLSSVTTVSLQMSGSIRGHVYPQ